MPRKREEIEKGRRRLLRNEDGMFAKTQGAARPHSGRSFTEGYFVSVTSHHADIYTV